MHRDRTFRAGGPARILATVALGVAVLAGCGGGGGAASDGPEGVVRTALDRMAAMDIEGLGELACAGQEDAIRDQLGVPGSVGGDLLPGLDTQQLLEAVKLDVSKIQVGEAIVDGDVAEVPIEGDLSVTFDAEAMRPVLREVLGAQGQSMTDEQLDTLLVGLEAYGQAVPLDTEVRLVRESGAWKVCQENVTP